MPRIPVIEQTTGVSLSSPSPQASAPRIVDTFGGAAQNLSHGLGEMAQAAFREQQVLTQKENADAVANLSTRMSDAQIYWQQQLTDNQKATKDGGMLEQPDGTTIGLRGKMQGDFDTWSKGFLDGVKNPKAKLIALEQVNHLRTSTLGQALNFEAQAGRANRSEKIQEFIFDPEKGLATQAATNGDPEKVKQLVETAKIFIANSGFDEATRNAKALEARNAIVESAVTGELNRNPTATRAALIRRYGVDPMAPAAGSPAAAGGNLSAADAGTITDTATRLGIQPSDLRTIISYETGGKFSPGTRGGKNNAHIGLIQFGPNEQKTYGANQQQTFSDQMKAVEAYLKDRGVQPGDDLKTLYKIVNGGNRNVSDQASDGNGTIAEHVARMQVEHAGGPATASLPPAQVSPGLQSLVEQLPIDKVPTFISHATTLANQQQTVARTSIEQTLRDQSTQVMTTGAIAQPLSLGQFVQAYGAADGSRKYHEEYVPMLGLGAAVSATYAMPNVQQDTLLETMKPAPNAPAFEAAQKRYETYAQAINLVRQQRAADPIAFSVQQKVGGMQPLDISSPDKIAQGMTARLPQAKAVSSLYGTPLQILSKPEAEGLKRGFMQMSGGQQGDYLLSLNKAMNDPASFRSLIQQVAPDSPETQIAAALISQAGAVVTDTHQIFRWKPDETVNARETANWILVGRHLINPTSDDQKTDGKEKGWSMPKEADFKQKFNNVVDTAFAGNPKAYMDTYQAVRAYYAGKSSFMGKVDSQLTPNEDLIKEAVKAVTGGVTDTAGGNKVLMPWGMKEGDFQKSLLAASTATFAANGITGDRADLRAYRMIGAGNGQYYLLSGTEPLRNAKTGEKVIVDVLGASTAQAAPAAATPAPVGGKVPTGRPVPGGAMPTGKNR